MRPISSSSTSRMLVVRFHQPHPPSAVRRAASARRDPPQRLDELVDARPAFPGTRRSRAARASGDVGVPIEPAQRDGWQALVPRGARGGDRCRCRPGGRCRSPARPPARLRRRPARSRPSARPSPRSRDARGASAAARRSRRDLRRARRGAGAGCGISGHWVGAHGSASGGGERDHEGSADRPGAARRQRARLEARGRRRGPRSRRARWTAPARAPARRARHEAAKQRAPGAARWHALPVVFDRDARRAGGELETQARTCGERGGWR